MQPLTVAVVTGGHSYDVPNFHRLFRQMAGLECYIQHVDDFTSSPQPVRESYGVVLFYSMMMAEPQDEGQPWYAGEPRTALAGLGRTQQGIVLLHHALVAYPEWGYWRTMAGITARSDGYDLDQRIRLHVADPDHPITQGLRDWEMVDETYRLPAASEDSHVLVTTDHPASMPTLAWTRMHGNSRVFCFECGHDNQAWADERFRTLLRRGIRWAGRRL
jgi:hypothetical protein